jgi:hypothetical protein
LALLKDGGIGFHQCGALPLLLLWSMGYQGRKYFIVGELGRGGGLSPMLFLLVMEPLHMFFQKAQEFGLLSNLSKECDRFRVSLYADDAALFIKPIEKDLNATIEIMSIFAATSSLFTNMAKSGCYPIHCVTPRVSKPHDYANHMFMRL